MPIKERKSVELFENGLPKEFLNSQVRDRLKITTFRVALERKVVYVFLFFTSSVLRYLTTDKSATLQYNMNTQKRETNTVLKMILVLSPKCSWIAKQRKWGLKKCPLHLLKKLVR